MRKVASRQKDLFQKNLSAVWWGGEESSPYIKRTSGEEEQGKFFSAHQEDLFLTTQSQSGMHQIY